MSMITVPQEQFETILRDSAAFANAAGPKLEKLSSFETGLTSFAKKAADKMASAGIIKAENVDSVANDLVNGGFDKIAEAFDFALRFVSTPKYGSMAKEASHTAEKSETADELWNRRMGLTNT